MDVVVCDAVPNSELFRVQLPSRKRDVFEEGRANPRLRYKKKAKVMELRLDADIHSTSYDKNAMERLPPRDHLTNMPPEIFEGRCFDSPNPLQYAVAFVKDSKMYMYPLDGSIELRRTLAHINFFDRKTKEENDGNTTGESESESAPSTQAIRVKFSRQETDRQKKRREASALHRERTIAGENWIPLELVNEVDNVSSRLRAVSLTPPGEGDKNGGDEEEVIETKKLIVTTLGGAKEVERETHELADCPNLSLLNASALPLNLQVRSLLLKSLSISTSTLCSLVTPPSTRDELIPILRQFAHLVKGVWVVDSSLLFRPPITPGVRPSRMTDARGHLWRNARDFALALIDADLKVTRGTLRSVFRLSRDDAAEVLETIGVSDPAERTWKLNAVGDTEEIVSEDDVMYPIQVEEAEHWMQRWEEIMRDIGDKASPRRVRRHSTRSNRGD
ncbi:hypothetical protein PRIPAC_93799 [Pristionchus pacificus]|nr:hypothetical protein PRIPAC_93799 [Pristionchus pacificus]|eukprot:PDM62672.1 hypothetical protein PRIPAC_49887 [Pristionchus pacificus]